MLERHVGGHILVHERHPDLAQSGGCKACFTASQKQHEEYGTHAWVRHAKVAGHRPEKKRISGVTV